MTVVISAALASYFATKPLPDLSMPWRKLAALLHLPERTGGALDALARRTLEQLRRSLTDRTAAAALWKIHDAAAKQGVEAGLQQLAQSLARHTGPAGPGTPSEVNATAQDLADAVRDSTLNGAAELLGWSKTWKTRGDGLVRPAHRALNGQKIPATDSCRTPDGQIRYPHDPAAPISLTANCRCSLLVTGPGGQR